LNGLVAPEGFGDLVIEFLERGGIVQQIVHVQLGVSVKHGSMTLNVGQQGFGQDEIVEILVEGLLQPFLWNEFARLSGSPGLHLHQ
jgi:hypothetical protein